jgi:hypothetical protein
MGERIALSLQKGLYWLQPPAAKSNRGNQFRIDHLLDRFSIGWACQYIRTEGSCIGGPGQYIISWGDQYFIGHLQPTLLRGVVSNTALSAVCVYQAQWRHSEESLKQFARLSESIYLVDYKDWNSLYLDKRPAVFGLSACDMNYQNMSWYSTHVVDSELLWMNFEEPRELVSFQDRSRRILTEFQ